MTQNLQFALEAVWKVFAVALLIGAGLPVIFALGVRSLAWAGGSTAEVEVDARPHPVGRVVAVACFAVVLAGIALGLAVIIATGQGKVVSFDHGFPTIADKPE